MEFTIRQAEIADIAQIQIVRRSVRENRLVSMVITDEDCRSQICDTGRGWVAEVDGKIVGFAIGNREKCEIWALFLDPNFEGAGIGRRLHDEMLAWMFAAGCERIRLSTEPRTRAERFYLKAGWIKIGETRHGEILFEKTKN